MIPTRRRSIYWNLLRLRLRPAPLLRRRAGPSSTSTTLHWGAKRWRTALGRRRDWSDLDDGPAGLIAESVLPATNGVVDYIRFRAVCRAWRRCCADPRARALLEDSRLHPRGWVMLLAEGEKLHAAAAPHRTRRRFLNVSTGQCIQVDVPELRDHGVLRSTDEDGLLLLLRRKAATGGGVRLLNPLTRQVAELPLITGDDLLGFSPAHVGECSTSWAGLVDGRWVFLYGHGLADGTTLAFAKPGRRRALLKTAGSLMPTVSFAGRFYGVTTDSVMVVDSTAMGGEDDPPPRLVVAAKLAARIRRMTDTAHLVDNGGELMLVHRRMRRVRGGADGEYGDDYKRTCKVYRVNLAAGKATPAAAAARGRAIFIDHSRALAVSPRVFPVWMLLIIVLCSVECGLIMNGNVPLKKCVNGGCSTDANCQSTVSVCM
ncbi:uncharacterized protein [Setaria viridis]|uniref:KIB1-4 beta-propeller domain-containing protein n=1 Tax=Setaria viridis TaxID=4556 RepID=A0A4U6WAS2_SETVI|nr:uncharacterized protein LOC117850196 [Setaria viridis]TKW38029.1 hypothetical protein SEVIR_1G088100v2 [Setaria viridis]